MTLNQGFPKELLDRPVEDRIAYFEGYVANHPIIQKQFQELWESIHNPGSHSILYVFGPTGVGKTTLYKKLMSKLVERELENMEKNPGIIPYIGTRAIAPESGNFDWKDFYIRTLERLKEPLIDKKILLDEAGELKYGAYHNDRSTKAYRKAMENALVYRKNIRFSD
jgi:GTPase SAR1 family protein